MELKCVDIKKNDYKLQAALKKPWYMSHHKFYRRIRRFAQDLPNYNLSRFYKYILLDIYFDDTGYQKDLDKIETVTYFDRKNNLMCLRNIDHSRIVNIWI